jgi:hypothetical protein
MVDIANSPFCPSGLVFSQAPVQESLSQLDFLSEGAALPSALQEQINLHKPFSNFWTLQAAALMVRISSFLRETPPQISVSNTS